MIYRYHIASLLCLLFLLSCEADINDVSIPAVEHSELNGTKELTDFMKTATEGVYYCTDKSSPFGDSVVFNWSGDIVSVFTGKNTNYMVLETGYKGSELVFEGYWRQANSDKTGSAQFKITSGNGGKDLADGLMPASIRITGEYAGGEGVNRTVEFIFARKFYNTKPGFCIIAHKGGGRNIDKLPHSENSVELIEYIERLGANSIEIDVQLTKDKIPVLFHDEYLSKRTINEDYFIGKVSDYTFSQLYKIVTLRNYNGTGTEERIPTLEQVLVAVVNNTNLRLVWLDIKNPEVIPYVDTIQKKCLALAQSKGRDLEVFIGVPDDGIKKAVMSRPSYQYIPTLCEMDEPNVQELGSLIWAPRWSLGLLVDRVSAMHSLGKRVFVWTLDDQSLIHTYINESDFDGIVTNYSPVVAYEYYMAK